MVIFKQGDKMKRFLFILLIGLIGLLPVMGQEQILYRDNFTIVYQNPAVMPELLTGESIFYRVWLWDMAQGVPVTTSTTNWIFYSESAVLEQYVVTPVDPRKEYAVGVQLVHRRADSVETVSNFAVTTNAADVDPLGDPGVPFVYSPDSILLLDKVRNLRDSGI